MSVTKATHSRILTNDLIAALRRCTRGQMDTEQLKAVAYVVEAFRDLTTHRPERRQYDRLLKRVWAQMDGARTS